jgi:hypothetical protein
MGLLKIMLTQGVVASNMPLELTIALEPSGTVVPGERVRVLINVATPRWFTGGTRLRLPEVPGLVLLQNQEFASNATERRGEETWTVQRWSVDAFATRAGNFTLPPIEVTASVSVAPGSDKVFTRYTPPQSVSVAIPQALSKLDAPWVASPKVTLEQRIDSADTVALGSAIKRTITIHADGVMAMMLPSFTKVNKAISDIAGLQSYPEPPLLSNKATRGTLSAKREETTTYIATTPGEVRIPSQKLYWWNTTDASLQVLSTPEVQFTISGTALAGAPKHGNNLRWLAWLLFGLLSAVSGYWLRRSPLALWLGKTRRRLGARVKHHLQSLTANPLPDRLNPGGSPAQPWARQQPQQDSASP